MKKNLQKKVKSLSQTPQSEADPQGSWTGSPVGGDDVPVQDADDL